MEEKFTFRKAEIEEVTDYLNRANRTNEYAKVINEVVESGVDCAELLMKSGRDIGYTNTEAQRFRHALNSMGLKNKYKIAERRGRLFLYKAEAIL